MHEVTAGSTQWWMLRDDQREQVRRLCRENDIKRGFSIAVDQAHGEAVVMYYLTDRNGQLYDIPGKGIPASASVRVPLPEWWVDR